MKNKNQKKHIRFSKLYKKWYILLSFSFIFALVIYLLSLSSFMEETELKLTDYRFRVNPIPERADTNIVIIALDDGSLEFFKNNGISWPWPRSFYGYAVDYLTQAGAKAVIFDMQFYEPDIDREETYAEETDGDFALAMKNNGNVFLGVQLSEDSISTDVDLNRFSIPVNNPDENQAPKYSGVIAPLELFLNVINSIGVINVVPDRDGVIRRIPVIFPMQEYHLPQLAFSIWINQQKWDEPLFFSKNKIRFHNKYIPIDNKGNYIVNWYGNDKHGSPFKYYPFQAVISSASSVAFGRKPVIPLKNFRDKYIIIGATAAGLLDLKTNPYTKILPGMEIWATVLSNFLNWDFIKTIPAWLNFIITLFIIYFVFYCVTHFTAKISNILLVLLIIVIIGSNILLWKHYRILINFSMIFTGFIISYLLIVTVSYLLEGKSKREIRKIFTRYLHPDVIKKLEDNPDQIQLGGEEINATVLYTDIYNFTTFSETKTPQELVEDLNEYFQKLTGLVLEHGGLLDKYTGDGIMALFGAPISRPDHAMLACQSAFAHKKIREELSKKNTLSAPDQFHIKTRTGINSGPLVAGNIGSDKRMDYTAIGDTVNLAARLEGVNKIFQTNIIISGATYKLVKDTFLCRELDYLRVKGKKEPTRIFELIDLTDIESKPAWITDYEQALNLYREGKWNKAIEKFEILSSSPLNDKASKVMLDRCKYLVKNPPEEWDGILTLEVK